VDELPSQERDPLLGSFITVLDRSSLLAAIDVATGAFLDELRRGGPELGDRLAPPLLAFVQASSDSDEKAAADRRGRAEPGSDRTSTSIRR